MVRVEDGNNGATILFGSYVFKVDSSVGFCCYSLQDNQSDFPKDNLNSQEDLEKKKKNYIQIINLQFSKALLIAFHQCLLISFLNL